MKLACAGEMVLLEQQLIPSNSNYGTVYRTFYSHTNRFTSIDHYNDLVVAVGLNVIATNKVFFSDDSDFKDVYQPSLKFF